MAEPTVILIGLLPELKALPKPIAAFSPVPLYVICPMFAEIVASLTSKKMARLDKPEKEIELTLTLITDETVVELVLASSLMILIACFAEAVMFRAVIDTFPLLRVHIAPPPAVMSTALIVMLVAKVCAVLKGTPLVLATRIA